MPVSIPLRDAAERVPVVLVPGITGSQLSDPESGELAWGSAARLFRPYDGGYSMALPLGDATEAGRPTLVAPDVLHEIRFSILYTKPVYGPIAELLEANGYRHGDLSEPLPGDTYFTFAYDWRQDNLATVRELHEKLEGLRRARGEERLAVALICQSNGAHICRYLAKYGDATLEEAEAGKASPPSSIEITRLLLAGTSNGGSLRILRSLERGRRYVPFGRRMQPETLFTFPSLYQDLPVYRRDLFLGPEGEPLDVDLFDAESWRTYDWSVFDPRIERRLTEDPRGREIFGDEEHRFEFLEQALDRARRFHGLLRQDVEGFGPTRYYLIQNVYKETPDRALLVRREDHWQTLFTGDRELRDYPRAEALARAPGDGHATRDSQMWLSPQELDSLAAEPFYVPGHHFELILEPATLARFLDFLGEP